MGVDHAECEGQSYNKHLYSDISSEKTSEAKKTFKKDKTRMVKTLIRDLYICSEIVQTGTLYIIGCSVKMYI